MSNNFKPIKVLQLGSPTGLYGAERWILALVRNLNPTKVHSIVSAIKDDPVLEVPLCARAEEFGFEAKIFTAYGKYNISAVKQLKQYIVANKIDILHTHGYKQDLIGFLATRGTNCKIISTPHGWSRNAGFTLQCYEALDRLIFPFLNTVAPLSPDLYNNLRYIPFLKDKLKYIQNGVDTIEIEECKTIDSQLIEWKKKGYFIIGYIGQLIHRKGLDILFRAAAMLDIEYKIALIGKGEQQDYLEQLAADLDIDQNVTFFGFKSNRLEYLNGFDIFVLPSRLEGIPRCLMEALTAQIPVVSSNIPGSTELIKDGRTGYLFTSDNPAELAQKILLIKKQYPEMSKIKQRGKATIIQEYSALKMAKKYEVLFSAIYEL